MKHPLDTADVLFEQLKALQPLKPEDQARLDKKFRLEFNYNSNHIEGNTLTYGETELLLIFDDTKGGHSMREYEEMKSHDVAWQMVEEWAGDKERPLTEQHIKKLNEILLVRPFWKDAITPDGQATRRLIKVGDYKEKPNSVRLPNGEIFNYTSPQNTPIEMGELIDWYREEDNVHPITIAAMLHYKLVRIHPFDDGNGRVSRLLMNYVLLQHGYPPVIIKSADKAAYLRALHIADIGDYSELIAYIAEQAAWSLELAVKAAKGESIEEPEDWDKELAVFKNNLGQKKDLKVEIKYSTENVQAIYDNTIEPLSKKWEAQLEKFDSLFYYRKCLVKITTNHQNDPFYESESGKLHSELDSSWEEVSSYDNETIIAVRIFCSYENMRVEAKEQKFWAGTVEFSFHDNAYEVSFQDVLPKKSLLYNEFLSDAEVQNIISAFSRNLMSYIKKATIE